MTFLIILFALHMKPFIFLDGHMLKFGRLFCEPLSCSLIISMHLLETIKLYACFWFSDVICQVSQTKFLALYLCFGRLLYPQVICCILWLSPFWYEGIWKPNYWVHYKLCNMWYHYFCDAFTPTLLSLGLDTFESQRMKPSYDLLYFNGTLQEIKNFSRSLAGWYSSFILSFIFWKG